MPVAAGEHQNSGESEAMEAGGFDSDHERLGASNGDLEPLIDSERCVAGEQQNYGESEAMEARGFDSDHERLGASNDDQEPLAVQVDPERCVKSGHTITTDTSLSLYFLVPPEAEKEAVRQNGPSVIKQNQLL